VPATASASMAAGLGRYWNVNGGHASRYAISVVTATRADALPPGSSKSTTNSSRVSWK
jgi:hypothetical protein